MSASNRSLRNKHNLCCIVCNKSGASKYSRCQGVGHCSKDCQCPDWKVHKLLHAPDSELLSPPRDEMIRALLFPENDETMKVIWLPYEVNDKTGEEDCEVEPLKKNSGTNPIALVTFPLNIIQSVIRKSANTATVMICIFTTVPGRSQTPAL